jgi:hypothetical protein
MGQCGFLIQAGGVASPVITTRWIESRKIWTLYFFVSDFLNAFGLSLEMLVWNFLTMHREKTRFALLFYASECRMRKSSRNETVRRWKVENSSEKSEEEAEVEEKTIINIPFPGVPNTITTFRSSVLNPRYGFMKSPVAVEPTAYPPRAR